MERSVEPKEVVCIERGGDDPPPPPSQTMRTFFVLFAAATVIGFGLGATATSTAQNAVDRIFE